MIQLGQNFIFLIQEKFKFSSSCVSTEMQHS